MPDLKIYRNNELYLASTSTTTFEVPFEPLLMRVSQKHDNSNNDDKEAVQASIGIADLRGSFKNYSTSYHMRNNRTEPDCGRISRTAQCLELLNSSGTTVLLGKVTAVNNNGDGTWDIVITHDTTNGGDKQFHVEVFGDNVFEEFGIGSHTILSTDSGLHDITVGGTTGMNGLTPDMYWGFTGFNTGGGSLANNARSCMYFGEDATSKQFVNTLVSRGNGTTTQNSDNWSRTYGADKVLVELDGAPADGTITGQADFDSLITDGIKLNITNQFNGDMITFWLFAKMKSGVNLFSGSHVNSTIGTDIAGFDVTDDVDDAGFALEHLFVMMQGRVAIEHSANDVKQSFGFGGITTEHGGDSNLTGAYSDQDGLSTTNCNGTQRVGQMLIDKRETGSNSAEWEYTASLPTGFKAKWILNVTGEGYQRYFFYQGFGKGESVISTSYHNIGLNKMTIGVQNA